MPPVFRLKGNHYTKDRRLDRLVQFDERSRQYPIRALIPDKAKPRSFTWSCAVQLDQGQEGACTGFGVAHEGAARPVCVKDVTNEVAQGLYHRARELDEWPGECVDSETECLSLRGWLKGSELREDDSILVFDTEAEATCWRNVQKVHRYDEKPFQVWSNKQFSAAVTDNHRWPVRLRPNGSMRHRPFRMTTTAEWQPGDEIIRAAPCMAQPQQPSVPDDFVELVAWVAAEGSYRPDTRRGNGIVVIQKVCKDRVAALMARMEVAPGYEKGDGCHAWEISGDLAAHVREVAPNRAPSIAFLRGLTRSQLELYLETWVLADGNIRSGDGRQECLSVSQKTGPILDSWLAACALAGVGTSRAREGSGSGEDVETWTMRRSVGVQARKLEPSGYQLGPVWCPQTSAGTFVARRKGCVFITGNSYEGSSVIAAVKAAQEKGWYPEYRWAFGLDDALLALSYHGPVIIGVNWYSGMFTPDSENVIHVTGDIEGGHCTLLNRINVKKKRVGIHNSWGGDCNAELGWDDLDRILHEQGEACVPVKRAYGPKA